MAQDYKNSYVMKKTNTYIPVYDKAEELSSADYEDNICLIAAFNKNLMSVYGYSLSGGLIERIVGERPATVLDELSNVREHFLSDILGDMADLKKGKPFYTNFPEEVMERDEAELYVNAVIYYSIGTYGFGLDDSYLMMKQAGLMDKELEKRPEIKAEFKDIKFIGLARQSAFYDVLKASIEGRSMPSWERDVMFKSAEEDTESFISLISDADIENHDLKAFICTWIYQHGGKDTVLKLFGEKMTGRDILRIIQLLSVCSDKDSGWFKDMVIKSTDISPKTFRIHLNAADKRFVKDLISASKSIFYDIWKDEKVWKIVMNHIHPKKGPIRSITLFDRLYNKDKRDEDGKHVYTAEAKIERDLKDGTPDGISGLFSDAQNLSGVFMRNAVHIIAVLAETGSGVYAEDLMETAAGKADPIVTLQTANAISSLNPAFFTEEGIKDRYARTAGGKLVRQKPSSSTRLSDIDWENVKSSMLSGISRGLDKALKSDKKTGRIYIDPTLKGVKVPQRQDTLSASDGCMLSTGSAVDISDDKNILLFGIWWYNEKEPYIDIDLAVHFFKDFDDMSEDNTETIAYTNLKNTFAVHSGDFTESDPFGDGSGAMELVAVDKELMRKAGYRYAVCEVNDYNGSFADSGKVRAFLMERGGSLDTGKAAEEFQTSHGYENGPKNHLCFDGELIEPSLFETNMVVNGQGRSRLTQMIDIKENRMLIIDSPYSACMNIINCDRNGEKIKARYIERLNTDAVKALVSVASHNMQPSIYEFVLAYAIRNEAELVSSPEDADTIFSVYPLNGDDYGGAEVYSTLNIGEFIKKVIEKEPADK